VKALVHLRERLPPRQEPRLVSRFVAVTALGLLLAGIGIFVVVERTVAAETERQAVDEARVTTKALLDRRLRPADLTAPLTAARRRQLADLLAPVNLGESSLGATLYGPRGAVFSTASATLRTLGPSLVRKAGAGSVTSRVATTPSGRVLRTALPLRLGTRELGVVELDRDYEPIAAATRRASFLAAGILESLLLVLCALLLPTLGRASRRLRRQVERLDWLASHDELTDLLNRAGFTRTLEESLRTTSPRGALLLINLDRFHEINETIGNEQGDLLLAEAGARLRAAVAPHAVARLGEDEFAVLLVDAERSEMLAATRTVHNTFGEMLMVNGIRIGIAVRVGGVMYPDHGLDADTLIRHASVALTAAKEERGRVALYTEQLEHHDVAQLALIGDLRTGLREGQLLVHYQPQVDVGSGAVRGVEALVRWQHPERGLLAADEFIGVVERTDLISELGRFVLRESIEQWRRWRERGIVLDVGVNLSTIDLLDLTLPGTIVDLLIEHGMPADRLVLEITETTLLRDEERTDRVLRQLEQIGVALAIDDYGTGYSSLARLRKLPVRQVKIDRSFVSGIPGDTDNDTIVQSTIQLAHTLGAVVVAEGVETETELQRLRSLSCDIAQGYLVGRPGPPEDVEAERQVPPRLRVRA
jgi:diguanylate cyclase (GGDEF)-like protein